MTEQTKNHALAESRLNDGLGADGERIFISPRFDGEKGLLARASSGWLLAECVIAGRIANGGHDGTEKGKHCFNLIANAMLDGVELPKIIHYIPPNAEIRG